KLDADGTKITNEINLTVDNQMRSFYPKIIWNGSEFGIIWEYRYNSMNPIGVDEPTDCSLLFTRVSNSGVQQGGNVQVITRTTADLSSYASCPAEADMVWDGTGYGVVWKERRAGDEGTQIYFRRIDVNGQFLTDDIEVTQATLANWAKQPSIVWTGIEYGIAWHDDRDFQVDPEIYFVRLDTAGTKQGSEIRITNTSHISWKPDLHWNGSGYDLFWLQGEVGRLKQIYFAKLDDSGNKITNDISVTSNPSNNYPVSPHAVWDGTNYGIAWTLGYWLDEEYDDVEHIIYFAKVDPNGSIINLPARVFAGSFQAEPAISWSGSKYGIAWSTPPGTGGYDIYFASDSGEVAILEQEQQLSFVERLLKDIQSQVAAISTAISELLK
ncbi:hypothetical protein KA005_58840, partial [bacterium]|nr:hypothetical protein [bacterium]